MRNINKVIIYIIWTSLLTTTILSNINTQIKEIENPEEKLWFMQPRILNSRYQYKNPEYSSQQSRNINNFKRNIWAKSRYDEEFHKIFCGISDSNYTIYLELATSDEKYIKDLLESVHNPYNLKIEYVKGGIPHYINEKRIQDYLNKLSQINRVMDLQINSISTNINRIVIGMEEINYTNILELKKALCGIIPMGVIDIVKQSSGHLTTKIPINPDITSLTIIIKK